MQGAPSHFQWDGHALLESRSCGFAALRASMIESLIRRTSPTLRDSYAIYALVHAALGFASVRACESCRAQYNLHIQNDL